MLGTFNIEDMQLRFEAAAAQHISIFLVGVFDVQSCLIFQRFCQDIIGIKFISDNHVLVASAGRHRKMSCLFGVYLVGKVSDFLKKFMGYLCDYFRWRLRLDLLRLRRVGSPELFFMWPLVVAFVLGRYVSTGSAVKPGHDVKALRLLAWMKVILGGLKQAS